MYPETQKPYGIYIHGLGSGAASSTKSSLCTHLKEYEWIAPEVTEDPYESVAIIDEWAQTFKPALIAGTSLGGFYTLFANYTEAVKIAVNATFQMEIALRKLGYGHYQYSCERENGEKQYTIDEPMIRKFIQFRQEKNIVLGKRNLAIFSTADELIGRENSKKSATAIEETGFEIVWCDKFGHRLNERAVKKISEWLG